MAEALWNSRDPAAWQAALDGVPAAQRALGKKTKYGVLAELHRWYKAKCPGLLADGKFGRDELLKLVGYKLTRGKMRPTYNTVASNPAPAVKKQVEQAAELLGQSEVAAALEALCCLRGVGPGTGSVVLAALAESCCYMGDEALEAALGAPDHGKRYDHEQYMELLAAMRGRADELGEGWTARGVEEALYGARLATKLPGATERETDPPPKRRKKG